MTGAAVRGVEVNEGRVSLSRLAERCGGWLGARIDPAEAGSEFQRDDEPRESEEER